MGSFTPPPTTALSPGDRLDRYELLCVLAQGGMGTVWLSRLTGKHGFERLVALKTILQSYGNDRQFSDMFLDEGRIAAQIDHENVARILEIGEDRGVIYHAMELIDGESLRKVYRDVRTVGAAFPLAVALRIAADTCAGLHAVHELKDQNGIPLEVVHRDVSPQNILVSVRGTIKLIDFGVAKARQRRTEETTAGTLKGKIEYMAPEQARGEAIDRRADVYAIGAVLYELLSGEPVRNTEEGRQLLALHELMTGAPYAPLHHSIPLVVRSLVDRSLARDPNVRFRTAEEMRHALEHALSTLGQRVNTDDVANMLAHFSRERTMRRKEAIDAAVRAAQAQAEERAMMVQTVVAPTPARPAASYGEQREQMMMRGGTQVLGVTPLSVGEGASTGPSMRTMQGAAMSGAPPAPPNAASRVFGAVVVLSIVAILGVALGVFVSHGPEPATKTAAAGNATPGAPIKFVATAGPSGATAPAVPVAADPSAPGTILGASDAGTVTAGSSSAKPAAKRGRAPNRGPAQKPESGDEYGF